MFVESGNIVEYSNRSFESLHPSEMWYNYQKCPLRAPLGEDGGNV